MLTYLDDTNIVAYEQRMLNELRLVKQQLLQLFSLSSDARLNHIADKLTADNSDSWLDDPAILQESESKPLVDRFRSLDAAVFQIQLGLFGVCADCEAPIEKARLDKDPTIQRCSKCEARYTRRPTQTRVWL